MSVVTEPSVLRLPLLEAAGLRHGFTTRAAGDFAAAALDTPDGAEALRRLGAEVGFDPDLVVTAEQVHGAAVAVVHKCERCGPGNRVPHTDGLITEEPWPLLLTVADCFPVILYQPGAAHLALLHCGWRGTVAGILPRAVRRLVHESGAGASGIRAGIGPGICADCYEVGDELVQAVHREGLSAHLGAGPEDSIHFDIAGALVAQLEACGVAPEHIAKLGRCTMEDPGLASFRRDHSSFRAAAVAVLDRGSNAACV